MLVALREAAQAAAEAGRAPDAVREAEALLGERAAAMAQYVDDVAPTVGLSAAGYAPARVLADEQWGIYQGARADMARLLGVLTTE